MFFSFWLRLIRKSLSAWHEQKSEHQILISAFFKRKFVLKEAILYPIGLEKAILSVFSK